MKNLTGRHLYKVAAITSFFLLGLSTILAFRVYLDPPACAIALEKENVFYIGIDHPITIVARGVPAEQLIITTSKGLSIQKKTGDDYIVRGLAEGTENITVSGGKMTPATFQYRVKRIPDPVPLLFNSKGKRQNSIAAVLQNFDYEAKCEVLSYDVTYLPKRQDAITKRNNGARFNSDSQSFIDRAKPGDAYFFDHIMALCPGDLRPRNLGSLAYKIK